MFRWTMIVGERVIGVKLLDTWKNMQFIQQHIIHPTKTSLLVILSLIIWKRMKSSGAKLGFLLANFFQLQKPNISLEKVGFGCKKKIQIQWKAFASFSLVFEAYIYSRIYIYIVWLLLWLFINIIILCLFNRLFFLLFFSNFFHHFSSFFLP